MMPQNYDNHSTLLTEHLLSTGNVSIFQWITSFNPHKMIKTRQVLFSPILQREAMGLKGYWIGTILYSQQAVELGFNSGQPILVKLTKVPRAKHYGKYLTRTI